MLKKIIKIVSIVWITVMAIAISISYYYNDAIKNPFKDLKQTVSIDIKTGDTINSILSRIDSKAHLSKAFIVKFYMKNNSEGIKLKADSQFDVKPGMSAKDILAQISNPRPKDPNEVKVTIVEGTTVDDIAKNLESKGIISAKDFIDACNKYNLPPYIKKDAKRKYALEGYLYPDTYYIKKSAKGNEIIKILLGNFDKKLREAEDSAGRVLGDDEVDKIIIMASMIESEVKTPSERPIVSSVFYNRLKLHMKLGSDATVQYALGQHKESLTEKDTQVNSPYNTYMVDGLPEGPISNPRMESIAAAIAPADTKYLYFFAKSDGTHVFNESYEQHLAAAKKYGK